MTQQARGDNVARPPGGGRLADRLWLTCLIVICCGIAGRPRAASACTVPVFRYALDRWEADPFRLVVPAAWAIDREKSKLLVPLRGNPIANVRVEETDAAGVDRARLLFPDADVALWEGPVEASSLGPLLDSPARRDLLARLLAGDSVVWVVVGTAADAAEVERIAARLRFLEQVGELPEQDPADPDSRLGPGPPLRLKFSVLHVSLDDPAEHFFVRMLAGPDHAGFVSDRVSFAAPVFGRGRVLCAWPLAELDDPNLEDMSLFLTGRCSCGIKNDNPGWDLLLAVAWDTALVNAEAQPAASPAGEAAGPRDEPTARAVEAVTRVPAAPAAREPGGRLSGTQLGGIALAILAALAGWRLWRAG